MKNKRNIFIYILLFVLALNTGCETQKAVGDKKEANIENNDTHSNSQSCQNIHLKEAEKYNVSVSDEKNLDMNVVEQDEYAQINNHIINGNDIVSLKKGFHYRYEKDGLKCSNNGKTKTIIKYQYSEWNSLYFADKYIYYTDINDENKKTYICRVDYQGNQKKKLYTMDVYVDQIYLYNNELWFVFHEFENIEKSGLGRVNCSTYDITVYENIDPEGTSEAGNKISIANGCVYFNSSGFKRLNIQKNVVEELFPSDVEGVNFAEDCIIFYRNKTLYKRDSKGVKKLWRLKGKTAGFEGIKVEKNKIYIQTYERAFYKKISEINKKGKIIRTVTKG